MGSFAYGINNDMSDIDIYGFCIPSKHIVFPHINGHINGFGPTPQGFDQFQEHHIVDPDNAERTYDLNIYNIIKYFNLCLGNNPNMVDSLFVPRRCIIHETNLGRHVRENRKLFLSKHVKHTFMGYSFAEMHKVENKKYANSKRKEIVDKWGYDPKNLSHVRRLLQECVQILAEGDLDLEKDNEVLKAIRRGEVGLDDTRKWIAETERTIEKLYSESTAVPHKPDEAAIKQILIDCLEMHYGSLSNIIAKSDSVYQNAVIEMKQVLHKHGIL